VSHFVSFRLTLPTGEGNAGIRTLGRSVPRRSSRPDRGNGTRALIDYPPLLFNYSHSRHCPGHMNKFSSIAGTYRITEMSEYDQDFVDAEVEAYIRFDAGGTGNFSSAT
jgi:hypothetical protein